MRSKKKKNQKRPKPASPPVSPSTLGPTSLRKRPMVAGFGLLIVAVVMTIVVRQKDDRDNGTPSPDGTPRMIARLKEIARNQDIEQNVFANAERVHFFKARLREETDREKRLKLRIRIAYELLAAGETEPAIDRFKAVLAIFERDGIAPLRQIREFLGVAYLRLGEQDNCLAHHSPDSCLLPLRGGGVHQNQRGARSAITVYTALLRDYPEDVTYRWLLNIAYMAAGEYPAEVPERWRIPPETFESEVELPRFFDIAQALGVAVIGLSGGAVLEDFDGDGYLDIAASSWLIQDQIHVFRNSGDGTFVDRTEAAGLIGITGGLNLTHADYDNDGDADILVLRGAWLRRNGHHPNSLLQNDGKGNFTDVTEAAGLLSFHPTQTAAWADFDDDGWLDLFIGNESTPGEEHPCELYRNNGDGTFTEIAARVGLAHVGFVKGVACGDYDDDGRIDIYLSRYRQPNILFHNEGGPRRQAMRGWKFRDVTWTAGVAEPYKSFPTWFWDYDNDGDLDLLVASMLNFFGKSLSTIAGHFLGAPPGKDRMYLYRNNGDGTFSDASADVQLNEPILAMGSNYGDLNNDGFLDCYFGTGEPDLATLVPNRMFLNVGGKRFANVSTVGGFGHLQKGHGVAFGDLDNDGDQDIYVTLGGAYSGDVYPNALFENPGSTNHWVTLILEGVTCNRSAIGARVRVTVEGAAGTREIHVTVGTGGSFGSSSLQQEIGLGDSARIVRVAVRWPGETSEQSWEKVPLDQFVRLRQGAETFAVEDRRPIRLSSRGEQGRQ